ncbi:Lrp/AsnC family transcriptional regulator [Kutzneria chonburiensis]|uniref:Lrp/AsnC family transcriptional regulator n=1 Tax=Kutzneria chonburiensis TaxID=1483604 RepID=A0ABV6MJ41_9PSEU|nr:Lrp/AsnC family transcriptional regulator [Kutzneria chonburiensis]
MRQILGETERRIVSVLLASPRASWRAVGLELGISERTVVRRALPLFQDGTLRATVVRNPMHFPGIVPMALRIRCAPNRIRAVAAVLARRPDTVAVDIIGGGDEICVQFMLAGAEARNLLLLRDLPATAAVESWTSYTMLRVFPTAFLWNGKPVKPPFPVGYQLPPTHHDIDEALIAALVADGRASYTDLALHADTSPVTARRRLDALVRGLSLRLAIEVDLGLLGIHGEALLWLNVAPGDLDATGEALSQHPLVRFAAATTGRANLLVAVAAADLPELYAFLTGGGLDGSVGTEVTPILTTVKRTGLIRAGS